MDNRGLQNQSETVRVPLYTGDSGIYNVVSQTTPEQYYINQMPYVSRNAVTGDGEVQFKKRPPFIKAFDLSGKITGTGYKPMANIGVTQLNDVMVCAYFDNAGASADCIRIIQYRPSAGTSAEIGSISSANTTGGVTPTIDDDLFITEVEITSGGLATPGIMVSWKKYNSTYSDAFHAVSSSGAFTAASLTKITAASFPVTLGKVITGPFQQLNGIYYIMGIDGYIYGSGGATGIQNDPTQWDSTNKIKCNQEPDAGVSVVRYKHHLVAFGRSSVEFFNDVGNAVPASALGVTEQAFIKFGAFSPRQIINIEDTLFWASSGKVGTSGIYKLEGYTPVKISNTQMDQKLQDYTSLRNAFMSVLNVAGVMNLVVSQVRLAGIFNTGTDSNNNDDIVTADTTDYPGVSDSFDTSYIQCYNIQDRLWWSLTGWITASQTSVIEIFPASYTNYNYITTAQYVLQHNGSGADSGGKAATVYSFDMSYAIQNNFKDSNGNYSVETFIPYGSMIVTNQFTFGNHNRKKVSKARLVMSEAPSGVSGTYSAYLGVLREQKPNAAVDSWRRYILPTTASDSIQWRNLGQGRSWKFVISEYTPYAFSPRHLEVDVHMGTK